MSSNKLDSDQQGTARLIFKNGTLIDGTGGSPRPHSLVIIENGKFTAADNAADLGSGRAGDLVYDVSGKTVLPGLIDAHVHICGLGTVPDSLEDFVWPNPEEWIVDSCYHLRLQLESGFTTVKDSFALNEASWALRRGVNEGKIVGSRLIASGRCLTPTGEHGADYAGGNVGWKCDSLGDLRKAIRRQAQEGADFIKLMCSRKKPGDLPMETVPAYGVEEMAGAVEEAHFFGLMVSGHISDAQSVAYAVQAGLDTVEHMTGAPDPVLDEMAEKGLIMVPTLAVLYMSHQLAAKDGPEWAKMFAAALPPLEGMYAGVRRAHERGVRIAAGTDAANPGVIQGESALEMELLVKAGLSPMDAIVAGTKIAAQACGRSDLGTVEVGQTADLIVFDGDPLADIRQFRAHKDRITYVVRDGELLIKRA